jgi:hypothetical protein
MSTDYPVAKSSEPCLHKEIGLIDQAKENFIIKIGFVIENLQPLMVFLQKLGKPRTDMVEKNANNHVELFHSLCDRHMTLQHSSTSFTLVEYFEYCDELLKDVLHFQNMLNMEINKY